MSFKVFLSRWESAPLVSSFLSLEIIFYTKAPSLGGGKPSRLYVSKICLKSRDVSSEVSIPLPALTAVAAVGLGLDLTSNMMALPSAVLRTLSHMVTLPEQLITV